jgi:hypothetical protein
MKLPSDLLKYPTQLFAARYRLLNHPIPYRNGSKLRLGTIISSAETLNQAYIGLSEAIPCAYWLIIEKVCPHLSTGYSPEKRERWPG